MNMRIIQKRNVEDKKYIATLKRRFEIVGLGEGFDGS